MGGSFAQRGLTQNVWSARMNWSEFFSMGERAFYVWGSFGAFGLAIIVEIVLLRMRLKKVKEKVNT
jgi:heme exporter protein CcmD